MRLLADENFPKPMVEAAGVVLFRVHPATPATIGPLVGVFAAAGARWAGHVSVVTPAGIQMLATRRR